MLTRIDAVVFAVGGVLTPGPGAAAGVVDTTYGLPPGTTMSFFRGGEALFARCETGGLALADFCEVTAQAIRARYGTRVPASAVAGVLDACMGDELRHDVLALVLEVKAAGHRVGLLADIAAERRGWLHALLPAGSVDVVVDSSAVGVRKPDRRLYDRLLADLVCVPEQVVYVDDHAEGLAPARALGMAVVLLADPQQARRDLVEAGVRIPAAARAPLA